VIEALAAIRPVEPAQGNWTYADYLALPDDGRRYEIIEGVLYVSNAPSAEHQLIVTNLATDLLTHVRTHRLGQVIVAPFEVHLSERTRPVQPDLIFVSSGRWLGSGVQFFKGAPDLVVEVLSPSSIRTDRVIKFTAYEQASVAEYWIVNPGLRSIEVYTLSHGEYALLGEFSGEQVVQSRVLGGLALVANAVFQLPDPQ
jgi:Uma2 family endonuclease